MSKIERKFLAHYIEAQEGQFVRLGQELEEYSPELSATVEKTKNILGQTAVAITGYEKSAAVAPYYARVGDPLFERLQAIIDGDLVLDALKTTVVEVKLWDGEGTTFPAVKEEAYIEVTSYGGDTTGYQIPFTIHYTGEKVHGTFNVSTKTFTAA
jgi:hypothetical protein